MKNMLPRFIFMFLLFYMTQPILAGEYPFETTEPLGPYFSVAVSAKGKYIAGASLQGGFIIVWNNSGRKTHQFKMQTISPVLVAFSPDEKKLLAVSNANDETVLLWDLDSKKKLLQLKVPLINTTTAIKYSPDGKFFIIGQEGQKLYFYDFEKDKGKSIDSIQLNDFYGLDIDAQSKKIMFYGSTHITILDNKGMIQNKINLQTKMPGLNKTIELKKAGFYPQDKLWLSIVRYNLKENEHKGIQELRICDKELNNEKNIFYEGSGLSFAKDMKSFGVVYQSINQKEGVGFLDARVYDMNGKMQIHRKGTAFKISNTFPNNGFVDIYEIALADEPDRLYAATHFPFLQVFEFFNFPME